MSQLVKIDESLNSSRDFLVTYARDLNQFLSAMTEKGEAIARIIIKMHCNPLQHVAKNLYYSFEIKQKADMRFMGTSLTCPKKMRTEHIGKFIYDFLNKSFNELRSSLVAPFGGPLVRFSGNCSIVILTVNTVNFLPRRVWDTERDFSVTGWRLAKLGMHLPAIKPKTIEEELEYQEFQRETARRMGLRSILVSDKV